MSYVCAEYLTLMYELREKIDSYSLGETPVFADFDFHSFHCSQENTSSQIVYIRWEIPVSEINTYNHSHRVQKILSLFLFVLKHVFNRNKFQIFITSVLQQIEF